jgi:glycosyltransferase involved in cell wall biosynthesis
VNNSPRLSLCIIAHNAYGALHGGQGGHVGGAEHQTSLLARWLAARGHTVSLITWAEGGRADEVVDGVRVLKLCGANDGLPGLRFLQPRLTALYAALRRAGAQVYYHNSAEYVTGLAAFWCRRRGRHLVYSVASDVACEPALPALTKGYERVLYRYGLRRATRRLVQTERQRCLLRESFGLDAVVLPMPCPGPAPADYEQPQPPAEPRVVWVGRVERMKRLEWLLELAGKLPGVTFEIAAANADASAYARALATRAAKLGNIIWRGAVARSALPDLYRRATCLCCTSSYEGFPNTFLEAWSHGRPVVTTFDPDGLVARLNLGAVGSTVEALAQAIQALHAAPVAWVEQSRKARSYYLGNHQLEVAMPRFERQFLEVCGVSGCGPTDGT